MNRNCHKLAAGLAGVAVAVAVMGDVAVASVRLVAVVVVVAAAVLECVPLVRVLLVAVPVAVAVLAVGGPVAVYS